QGLSTSDIKWYTKKYKENENCDISSWGIESWKTLGVKQISSYKTGDNENAVYQLDIGSYPSGSCIVAGVAGDFSYLTFENVEKLTATGIVTDILSPEYDMQSRIEFKFNNDIFTDSGRLYSEEYIEHRHNQKVEFLKKLSVSPGIEVREGDIELNPNKAVVYANFVEGKKYNINLSDILDIYGQKVSVDMAIEAESIPSLAIKIAGNKTIVKYGDPIQGKIYRTKSPKNEYEVKLCQISLEGYARIERMNELRNKTHIGALYELLSSNEVSLCSKKTITLNPGEAVANFDVSQFSSNKLSPGLYILAFQNKDDISSFDKWVVPKVFSIVDTHIVMKIDSSGKMQFLATDIQTGKPRENQDITLKKNIAQLYKQDWNSAKGAYDITYTPLSMTSWGTGVSLGRTTSDGILVKNKSDFDENPYNFTSEWWGDYEGRYNSFVAVSRGNGHFGYVVSTWNDGITGWNFGMKESDYGWDNRSLYSTYIHTDRRLYLPGETVYIKGIMRKNELTLTIPENEVFDIVINDPEGKTINTSRIKANAFGSIATNINPGKEAKLGSYSISIQPVNTSDGWISNAYTSFQVEIFKNPTFTAEVKLSSPEVKDGIITNIRESANNDPETIWYDTKYSAQFNIEGIVKAHYYNGATIKSVPFSYKIFKSRHYSSDYWTDCFWGCYFEPTPEFYTEGTGSIDSDGFGIFRAGVEFASFSDDYIYTAEVTINDPLSGESVTTPGTFLVGLGGKYKMYDMYNPLEATLVKKIITPSENIVANIKPKYGKWDATLSEKYKYELVHRSYTSEKIDTLRGEQAPIVHSLDTVVRSGIIRESNLTIDTKNLSPGEHFVRVIPVTTEGVSAPKESIHETLVYITGNFVSRDNLLRVIPEKTVYQKGETARVLITTPFSSGGHLYITRERGGVIASEYVAFTGSNYTKNYLIDESFYPNTYIGVVAFPTGTGSEKLYSVGYSEIVMDMTDKKGNISIKTDKETYKNREIVNLELTLTNKNNEGELGEFEIMVIDESLIRLLGNIDLDIIPKFFQKYPFTMKTALTAIGMERNRYLSRKGSNGGSGDKGGDGAQISSRTRFQNTAYYNPSLLTDKSGKANIKFTLPDNVTDYRIIVIGQTKSSQFSVKEKTIAVRRDYTLETHAPAFLYKNDKSTITASVFNSTIRVTPVTVTLEIGTGGSLMKKTETLILGASSSISKDFAIEIGKDWAGTIPYTITLREKSTVLDSITKTLDIPKYPIITDTKNISGYTSKDASITIPSMGSNTDPDSEVSISISDSPLQNPEKIIQSMISYPYGCIEQTISSTMPNAIAIQLAQNLGLNLDLKQAQENLTKGVEKILKMQDISGGWYYWEGETSVNTHVTPYVIRSLYEFRKLGVNISEDSLKRGLEFIANMSIGGEQLDQMDLRAEVFATLAIGKHPKTQEFQKTIDISKLSRHGYLIYHVGLESLGKFGDNEKKNIAIRMASRDSESYWYWDDNADRAIYSRLLLTSGNRIEGLNIIRELIAGIDMTSYYVSTQTKIHTFMALIELTKGVNPIKPFTIETGALKIPVKLGSNTHRYTYTTRRSLLGKTMEIRSEENNNIYYTVTLSDKPLDIFKTTAVTHSDLAVNRVFEKVEESKGLDTNGQFRQATPVINSIFKAGELYRARITVTPKPTNSTKYYLTLEDYIPGAWRPIRGVFNTESSLNTDSSSEYGYWNGWTYVEARSDRILATQDYVWQSDKPYTYTYYIRPEHKGTYLLPPVTAHYMYQGDIHAIGKYEKIIVE
ncbi:hypothetical protein K2X92_01310, partial [Candidatus Gracilibacteria bacterium]|nr:hypothetical protein [Candidatus Gracilibacteria bacterium]